MTTLNTNLIPARYLAAAQTTQYTSPSATATIVDKCVVTNTGAAIAKLSLHLVESSGTPDASNQVIDEMSIAPGDSYTCPEVVGHTLIAGTYISTLASVASSLVIMASGRQITI